MDTGWGGWSRKKSPPCSIRMFSNSGKRLTQVLTLGMGGGSSTSLDLAFLFGIAVGTSRNACSSPDSRVPSRGQGSVKVAITTLLVCASSPPPKSVTVHCSH